MSYEDFVWFIMSEEDKSSDTALEYWFRCADLDSDGTVRPREMWFFYEEQLKRMENLPSAETVLFEDVVCQLHDMLHPEVEGSYTLRWAGWRRYDYAARCLAEVRGGALGTPNRPWGSPGTYRL